MTEEPGTERVTMTLLYREMQSFRGEMLAKFDALDTRYPSIDAHDEIVRRVVRLEASTVPLATHDAECKRVAELSADIADANAEIGRLKERIWLAAGAASALGTIGSFLLPWILQHI